MSRASLVLLVLAGVAVPVAAQLNANNARGFEPEKAYHVGEIDHVNLFNGNLLVTLPIGQRYRTSDHLAWGLTLVYNGNPWNFRTDTGDTEPIPSRFANAGLGWQLTLGELVGPNDTLAASLNADGQWVYAAPDGAERAFFERLHANEESTVYEASETPAPGEIVGYTRDGTYLRLVRGGPRFVRMETHREPNPDPPPPFITQVFYIFVADYVIEFPDGTRHTLTSHEYANDHNAPPDFAFEKSARYRLTKMEDRFGNSVSVTSTDEDDPNAPTATWTITERAGTTVLRAHTVSLGMDTFRQLGRTPQSRRRVDSVTLSAFGGQTATYDFEYSGDTTISAPCNVTGDDPATTGNFLRSVSATRTVNGEKTALLTWSMEHDETIMQGNQVVCSDHAGHLESITLPTGGSIEYTAERRLFPSERTGDDPAPGPDMFPNVSTAVATRTVVETDGTRATTAYDSRLHTIATYYDAGSNTLRAGSTQMTVIVTDPMERVTHNHFFVANIGDPNSCFTGANRREYGLPFLRNPGTSEGDLLLSSEVYDDTCVTFATASQCKPACRNAAGAFVSPIRRSYVKYELDDLDDPYPLGPFNQRVSASRTQFTDSFCGSARCYTETRSSGFDGLGHYRTDTRSSNIPGTVARTTETNYNANTNAGTYAAGGGSDPDTYMIPPGSPWLLNLHDEVKTTEGPQSIVAQPCFDRTTGALQRHRVLAKMGTTPARSTNDLVTVFTTSGGNVTGEAYHGGDVVTMPQMSDPCVESPGVASYELAHAYEAGVRKSSHFLLGGGSTLEALDLTVDASTGLPAVSRDPADVATTYHYDVLGRLEQERPQGEAWTRYTYDLSARPASIAAETFASTVTVPDEATPRLAERRFYYDGHGRLIQSRTRMPSGWAVIENTFDVLGRRVSVTVPVAASGGAYEDLTPATAATTFAYDPFNRMTSVMTPDGKSTTTEYDGVRTIDRTVEIDGTETMTTETFDGHGRLTGVTERMWTSATTTTAVTTSYAYDAGNRLTSVTAGDQSRTFEYDGRGLLLREQHPETGVFGYGLTYYGTPAGGDVVPEYDARGQMTRRIVTTPGGRYDLKYLYDRAGRLTEVQDLDPATQSRRTLKTFTYAAANDTTVTPHDLRAGKLTDAVRNNYTPGLGVIQVREAYRYQNAGGRPTQRETVVTGNASFAGTTFLLGQSWNQSGQLETLTYPSTGAVSAPRTITNTYTDGLLTGVAGYASISYQANGLIDTVTHGSGAVKETWIADPTGMPRPLRIEARGPTNNLLWQYGNYAYDAAGNITAIGTRSFDYDGLNRLTGWRDQITGGYTGVRRELDLFGNYVTTHHHGCRTTPAGRMECHTSGSLAYRLSGTTNHYEHETYDDAGSVIADAAHAYGYDGAGSMTSLQGSGRNERFLYTADDERIAVVDLAANRTTWTLRDTSHRLLRTFTRASVSGNSGWSWTEDEIWRGGLLLASESPAGRKQYHLDHLGSPRAVTNLAGTTISQQAFQPFGEGGTSDGGRLQFTGHERDRVPAHGFGVGRILDYMHARYYAADAGRFLSVDPVLDLKVAMTNPQGWNRYSYVRNNPLNLVDPDGRQAKRACDPGMRCGVAALLQQAMKDDVEGDWNAGAEAVRIITPGNVASRDEVEAAHSTLTMLAIKYVLPFVVPGEGTTVNVAQNAAKGEVLAALRGGAGSMSSAQRAGVIRQVGRATTSESVTVVQNANGTVSVLRTRPGADGSQTFVTEVGRAGNTRTVQTAQNAAGEQVHYDPKGGTSIWKAVRDWFR